MSIRFLLRYAPLLVLVSCSGMPVVDQAAVDARAKPIEARIVDACLASQLFRPFRDVADGAIVAAYPIAALPIGLKNKGVERACTNPEAAASDVAGAEWVIEALTAQVQSVKTAPAPR